MDKSERVEKSAGVFSKMALDRVAPEQRRRGGARKPRVAYGTYEEPRKEAKGDHWHQRDEADFEDPRRLQIEP